MIIVLICSIMLIGNIFRTDDWTGDKPFSEYLQRDWLLFFIFLIEEIIIAGVMVLFALSAGRISIKRNAEIAAQLEKDKYLGIKPGDYDPVWFDFSNTQRALIVKHGDQFKLYIQEYNERTENWENISGVRIYDSLEALKKALFYEFDFYCEENTVFDKYGNEIYKET